MKQPNQPHESHLSRDRLERFLSHPDPHTARHVESCPECQVTVRLLRTKNRLRDPYVHGEPLVQRLVGLPALVAGPAERPQVARTVSDSWRNRHTAPTRDAAYGVERRLRFEVAGFCIDLVVDKLGHRLECSLRISRRGLPVPGFAAHVGGRRMLPADRGFFTWTSARAPRQITLWSQDVSIKTGTIRW